MRLGRMNTSRSRLPNFSGSSCHPNALAFQTASAGLCWSVLPLCRTQDWLSRADSLSSRSQRQSQAVGLLGEVWGITCKYLAIWHLVAICTLVLVLKLLGWSLLKPRVSDPVLITAGEEMNMLWFVYWRVVRLAHIIGMEGVWISSLRRMSKRRCH